MECLVPCTFLLKVDERPLVCSYGLKSPCFDPFYRCAAMMKPFKRSEAQLGSLKVGPVITLTPDWHLVTHGASDRGMEDCGPRIQASTGVMQAGAKRQKASRSRCRGPKSQRLSPRRVEQRLVVGTVIIFHTGGFFFFF